MSNVNSVVVSGNLTRDPEVRWLADDGSSAIVNLGLAYNRQRKVDDEYVEETSFFDIDVFGGFANLVAKKLRKGDGATVQGRLEQQSYEKDGEVKKTIRIVAITIDSDGFFRAKDEDAAVAVGGSSPAPAAPAEAAATPAEPTAAPTGDDIPF